MLLELILIIALICLVDMALTYYANRNIKNVTFVSKIPIVGGLLVLLTMNPENFYIKYTEFFKRFGKTIGANILGYQILVTVDRRIVNTILASHDHLEKHSFYNLIKPWQGQGLIGSSGKTWSTMRKIITPTFHFKILEQFLVTFERQIDIFIEKLKPIADGFTVLNIEKPMSLLTLDIIAETAMGVSINSQLDSKSEFVTSIQDLTDMIGVRSLRPYLIRPLLYRLMAPKMYRKEQKCIKYLHAFTDKIIAEKQQSLAKSQLTGSNTIQNDPLELGVKQRMAFLDLLLQTRVDGQPLPDTQIRDEVTTFLFAGHDTTNISASFCLYAISRHPTVQEKLFKELHAHFGNDLNRPLNFDDFPKLTYLTCVIKESMRMYPPIVAIGRRLGSDLNVDGICIPKNSEILIVLWELLRDPEVFKDPLTFLPERHLETRSNANAFDYTPFSAGPRNCVGQKYAILELRAIVTKVLLNFELLPLGDKIQPYTRTFLTSASGINLGLKPRVYN